MIQVSGLQFTWSGSRVFGSRVVDVRVGSEPLAPQRTYRVATNSMLAGGGHNYVTFQAAQGQTERGAQYDMIASGLRARNRVAAPTDRRIIRANGH